MTPKRKITLEATEKALSMGREELYAKVDEDWRSYRKELLLELANNKDVNSRRISNYMAPFEGEEPSLIANAQRDLLSIWTRSIPFPKRQRLVDVWLDAAIKRFGRKGIHAWLGRGCLEFDYRSFPGQFVMAILENSSRFQVCRNPDCPAPYFLASRTTQRYCERGECTRYAQRTHALNWWRTKGKLRREGKGKKRHEKA